MRPLLTLCAMLLACSGQIGGAGVKDAGPAAGSDAAPPDDIPDPNAIPSDELFVCEGEAVASPERLVRIDRMEWAATIGREGTDARFNPLIADPVHEFSTQTAGETLDDVILDRFIDFSAEAVNGWRGRSDCSCAPQPEGTTCIFAEGVPPADCVRLYCETYLRDFALYREPTEAEVDALSAFATEALESAESAGLARSYAISRINSAAWLSTGALFRTEQGTGTEPSRPLADHELGKALAYLLTDYAPGARRDTGSVRLGPPVLEDIAGAVADGSISSVHTLRGLLAANVGGTDPEPAAIESEYWLATKVERFFAEWLGSRAARSSFHDDAGATADVSSWVAVNGSFSTIRSGGSFRRELLLDEQLDEMIARIVLEDVDVLSRLLTSRTYFVPRSGGGQLNNTSPQAVYNIREEVPAAGWYDLPVEERAGILTHPAWLAAHSDNFENGPSAVHRGKWIREELLCGSVPDVPITVDAAFPDDTNHLSARDRLSMATEGEYCQSCHELMNPLGLPFEIYNHAGFLRADDHGNPPNGESVLVETGDPLLDTHVSDAIEMVELLAESEVVEQCFVRKVFRYFAGRTETRADGCVLVSMQTAYQEGGGSFLAMLDAFVASPAFTHRRTVEDER